MTKAYTKLFHKILASSIWDEDDKTRIVWITMLAMTDENGEIVATERKVARDARVDLESCMVALGKFMAPDVNSTSPEHEGRRLERIDGGWRMLNHGKYLKMMDLESRRAYNRKKQAEFRSRDKMINREQTGQQIIRKRADAHEEMERGV